MLFIILKLKRDACGWSKEIFDQASENVVSQLERKGFRLNRYIIQTQCD